MIKKKKKEPAPHSKHWKIKADKEITRLTKMPCIICGLPGFGHHFIPKSRSSFLRHDMRNLFPLCSGHHMFSNEIAPHSNNAMAVHAFVEHVKKCFPLRFAFLIEHQHILQKPDYRAAYERLVNEPTKECTDY